MTLQMEIRRIEARERRIARKLKLEQEVREERERLEAERAADAEALVLALARETGLVHLPVRQIVERLTGPTGFTGSADCPMDNEAEHVTLADGPEADPEDGDRAAVIVRASKNVGEIKAAALAGLHWHGKRAYWHGSVTASRLVRLQELFGDQVEPRSESGSGAAVPSTANAAQPLEHSETGDGNTICTGEGTQYAPAATQTGTAPRSAPPSAADLVLTSPDAIGAPAKPLSVGRSGFPTFPRPAVQVMPGAGTERVAHVSESSGTGPGNTMSSPA